MSGGHSIEDGDRMVRASTLGGVGASARVPCPSAAAAALLSCSSLSHTRPARLGPTKTGSRDGPPGATRQVRTAQPDLTPSQTWLHEAASPDAPRQWPARRQGPRQSHPRSKHHSIAADTTQRLPFTASPGLRTDDRCAPPRHPPRPGHRHTNRSLLVRAGRRRAGEKGESSVGRRRRADSTKSGRDQGTAHGEDLDPRHARPLSPPRSDAALLKPFAPDVNPRALSSARLAPRTETVHGAGACAVHRPPPPLILGSHEALRVCDCYLRCTKAATHALEKSTSKGCSHHLALSN